VYLKPFRYERAATLSEAAEALRSHEGGARLIAGGQSLMPMMNLGLVEVDAVVDISRVDEARGAAEDDGYLRIGALNGRETKGVPVEEFHVTYFTTTLAEDEVLSSVRVPKLGPGWGWGFVEVSRRPGDFAIAAAAALVRLGGGEIVESRVVLGGVSERPLRLGALESTLTGARAGDVAQRVGEIDGIEPMTDTSATGEHRRHLSRVLAIRAVQGAIARAEEAA
jgi:CO/xanthine dehydrogenase FAD-binding subunit